MSNRRTTAPPHAWRATKRVLVYSHDTFGLGNIRRMLEISRHLVDSDPALQVLIITGSPMLHAFRIPQRIDYVKLPCLARTTEGTYRPKFLDISLDETVRLRANMIRGAMLDFRPDLVLVDKKPFGVKDELSGALESLSSQGLRPALVLLLRDILDAPEATKPIWRRNHYFEAIGTYYDDVLVVGTPDIFDVRTEYEFPPLAAAKVTYCGYIARARGCRSCAQVRAGFAVGCGERLVLVTPGGGEDGIALMRAYLEGLSLLPESARPHSVLVCGPEMHPAQRDEIVATARRLPKVSIEAFSDDMMSLMSAADLVVCMGGYNTVCEVLTLRKRAIVVPRVRPVQEQWIRAERMASRGLLRALHPDALTPQVLAATLAEELAALGRPSFVQRVAVDMDGLNRIAASIRNRLDRPLAGGFGERQPGARAWHLLPSPSAASVS